MQRGGWDEGYAAGLSAGRATVETELNAERDALAQLAQSLDALRPPDAGCFALYLNEVAGMLAVQAAGEAGIDCDLLMARAEAAASALAEAIGEPVLRLHPDDIIGFDHERFALAVAPDPELVRGSVRAEAGHAWAADGVREAIDRIRAATGL